MVPLMHQETLLHLNGSPEMVSQKRKMTPWQEVQKMFLEIYQAVASSQWSVLCVKTTPIVIWDPIHVHVTIQGSEKKQMDGLNSVLPNSIFPLH